ncbi:MAG: hypothetical protein DME20_07930 [Verrucomicrobia bacterium]|nr:MAG: hypothetical protein DME20_07930 [Verrucomicrobiota bacterium]
MGAGLRFGRPLNRKDGLDYCRAVLILQSKTVLVSHHPIKLFSFDGKTWFSTAESYREFKRRRDREKLICQRRFANFVD